MRNGDVPTPFWLSSRDVTRELLPEALLRARHHRALTQVRVEQRRAQLTVGDDPRLLAPERRHELAAARRARDAPRAGRHVRAQKTRILGRMTGGPVVTPAGQIAGKPAIRFKALEKVR